MHGVGEYLTVIIAHFVPPRYAKYAEGKGAWIDVHMAQQWFEKFRANDIELEEQGKPGVPEDYYIINSGWNIYKKLIQKYRLHRRERKYDQFC